MKGKYFLVRLSETEKKEFETARAMIEQSDGGKVSNPRVVAKCVKFYLEQKREP